MEGMIPYLASADWYSGYLFGHRESGITVPNRTLVSAPGRGGERLRLTVPVAGGSKALKRGVVSGEGLTVSGHGDWPRVHLGALEAAYGREPFWRHFDSELAHILTQSIGMELRELNARLDSLVSRFLRPDVIIREWETMSEARRGRMREYGVMLREECPSSDETFLARIAALGRDALLTVLPSD